MTNPGMKRLRSPVTNAGTAETLTDAEFHFKGSTFHVTERDGIEDPGTVYENAIIGGDIKVGESFAFLVGNKVHPSSKIRAILIHGPGYYEVCTNNSFYMLERVDAVDPQKPTPVANIVGSVRSTARGTLEAAV